MSCKTKILSIFTAAVSVFALISFLNFTSLTKAGSEHNTFGYAWSDNIGWISFNNTSDGSNVGYGVNVNTSDGKLSGYAWSDNIGWISFNESDLSGCPQSPCQARVDSPGQLGKSNVNIKGWARALAYDGGWDGWLRFDHGQTNEPYIDVNGDWHGWAWSDMVVGWISFNSEEGNGSSYKVTTAGIANQIPSVSDLSVAKGDYCSNPAHYFSWTYSDPDGDNQSQFQFQVDNNSDFSSPEVDRVYSGLSNPSPTTNNQTVVVAVSPSSDQIAYNTTYYWRVMVWDDQGAASSWTEGSSFTTEAHQYPSIDFDWSPQNPSAQEDVLFADQSTVYGGATKSNWLWDFEDGNPASSNQQNPTIQFTSSGSKQVTLQVTDSDGYACSDAKTVDVGLKLPGWKEALPE
jgi:PKD repeat protein